MIALNTRRYIVGLTIVSMLGIIATDLQAQTNQNDQSQQAENQDLRYFVYMRGIT